MIARRKGLVASLLALVLSLPTQAGDAGPSSETPGEDAPGFATLEDCYRLAAAANERNAIAREDLVQSELDRKLALARVLPQISAEALYYRQNNVTVIGSTGLGSGVSFSDRRAEAVIGLTQPIFSGLRERNYIGYTREAISASRFDVKDAGRRLYAAVASAFYGVLQAEADAATFRDSVELGRKRVDEMRARREVGLARKTEVLLIESQLAEFSSRLESAENGVLLARDRLDLLIGTPVRASLKDTLDVPAEALAPDAPAGPATSTARIAQAVRIAPAALIAGDAEQALTRDALASRADLRARERDIEAARRLVRVARGEYAPVLDLEAGYILGRQNYSTFAQETDWTAQLNFTLPLFDGGRIRATVAVAESRLHQAELAREELEREVRLEVRGAWLTVRSDASRLKMLEARLASSEENYQLAGEEYRNGLSTSLELFTAQNQLLAARLELERQRHQVKVDWLALLVAQGLLPVEDPSAAGAP